jgi:rRNA methylases
MIIESKVNNKIKDLCKLHTKKYRDRFDRFLIEGDHIIKEAYQKGYLIELIVLEGNKIKLPDFKRITYVTENIMKEITSLETVPKVIGVSEKPKPGIIGDKILILEDVQDPGNIGTIIRSSVAFNIDTLIMTKGCADIFSSKVIRATQGMIYNVNIIHKEVDEVMGEIKYKGIPVYGTRVNRGNNLKTLAKTEKFAIIMGNEGAGVTKETLRQCDEFITIRMNSKCESLNVGIATSIVLYEFDKKV